MKRYSHEGPNALLEHAVLSTQVHTEVEALDSAAEDPLLFQVCKHAPGNGSSLVTCSASLYAFAERIHFVRALFQLVTATWLEFDDVAREVARGHRLRSLHCAGNRQDVAATSHALAFARRLVGLRHYGKAVVRPSVRIEAKSNSKATGCASEPPIVALAQDAAQRVALASFRLPMFAVDEI